MPRENGAQPPFMGGLAAAPGDGRAGTPHPRRQVRLRGRLSTHTARAQAQPRQCCVPRASRRWTGKLRQALLPIPTGVNPAAVGKQVGLG